MYGTIFPFFCFNAIFMHAPRKMQWHYFKNAGCPHRGVMKKLNPLSAAALMYSGFKNFCMTKIIWLLSRCIFFGIFLSRALSFLIFANGSIFITHQLSYIHKKRNLGLLKSGISAIFCNTNKKNSNQQQTLLKRFFLKYFLKFSR